MMNGQARLEETIAWDLLKIDCATESDRIADGIRRYVHERLKRRGVVVALSGGIDSSVVGALCVRALGPERVFGLLLPEMDSSFETLRMSRLIVDHLGIPVEYRDITDILEALDCYCCRDEAIKSVIPKYDAGYRCKLVLPSLLDRDALRLFSVVVESPTGRQTRIRLPLKAYLQIIAAASCKQRVRTMLTYFHAARLNYAVVGTRNLLEYDQGFFVKQGDGTADIEPIAHLYKSQIYQMADFLELPHEIRERAPTAEMYSLPQDQEESYFSAPYEVLDVCLYGKNHDIAPEEIAPVVALESEQVERVYRDIEAKRRAAAYQHMPVLLIESPEQTCT